MLALFKAREFKTEYEYQNKKFREFIEAENKRYYLKLNVELIGGEYGHWIEIQLPDNEDDFKEKQQLDSTHRAGRSVIMTPGEQV